MGAVLMLLRTQHRQHWKSWLALAALVALAGGLVIAAATTAKRTAAAFPDFVARYGYDAVVYSAHPLPTLASIPQVAEVTPVPGPVNFPAGCDTCSRPIPRGSFALFEIRPAAAHPSCSLVACQPGRPWRGAGVVHAGPGQRRPAGLRHPGHDSDA